MNKREPALKNIKYNVRTWSMEDREVTSSEESIDIFSAILQCFILGIRATGLWLILWIFGVRLIWVAFKSRSTRISGFARWWKCLPFFKWRPWCFLKMWAIFPSIPFVLDLIFVGYWRIGLNIRFLISFRSAGVAHLVWSNNYELKSTQYLKYLLIIKMGCCLPTVAYYRKRWKSLRDLGTLGSSLLN